MEDQTGPSVQIEKGLMEQSSECYLSERIRQYGYIGWKFEAFQDHTKPRTLSKLLGSISPDSICNSSDSGFTQQLLLAAFTGNNPDLLKLLENYQSEIVSADGFTPVHLACIGGHLSTLKVLLEAGFSASKVACHGITALHLAIFFDDLDTTLAVNLLLKHGANPTLETTCNVVWDDHDCKLFGTPLDWAISTRNLKLVKVLLPKTPHSNGARIRSAISHFFWDIASEILNNSPEEKSGVKKTNCFTTLTRPFRHWIIHGKDRFNSIDRTLQICKEHDVDICVGLPKGSTTLMVLIEKARMEEDFYLIERLISVMESAEIKKYNNDGASALILAIIRATNSPHWKKILQALVLHYTVTELQEERLYGGSHLHMAVRTDSPVAARILLDIGVDPNQRTFDSDNITPLHICVIKAGSLEMCRVLVEYGADMNLKEHGTMATPLVHLARKIRPGNSILIDYILELDFPEIVYTDLLDETVHNFWVVPRTQHLGSRELLRHLLTIPKVARHVDDLNMEGSTTLLQTCAYQLCLEALELLLEAGADVNKGIPYRRGIFYPLQIACIMGRAYFLDSDDNPGPANIAAKEEKADRAIQIGLRLLERHHARMDDPFSGITELHM
jgi:ankyrin repeat protein